MPQDFCFVSNQEPFEFTLTIINGKWKLKIIYILACLGTVRYGIFKKNIASISHKMLSSQLDELEKEDIIARTSYPEVPPKVEYSLTPKGESLIPLLKMMCDWGKDNKP